MSHASHLSALLRSGDVSAAESYLRGWCSGRTWAPTEARAIRSACAVWGVDPVRFGVPAVPPCPPELWPLRAHFLLPAVPSYCDDAEFQRAAMEAASHAADGAYVWRMEAVRYRLIHGRGVALDLPAIQAATLDTMAMFARRAAEPVPMRVA